MMVTESSTMSASAHSEDRKENSFLSRARPITRLSQHNMVLPSRYVGSHFNFVPLECAIQWPQNQLGTAAVLHDQ